MIRKVSDIVQVKVISYNNKRRLVFADYLEDHQLCSFEIVAVTKWHVDLPNYYIIVIDDDIIGWTISKYHVEYNEVNQKHIGSKFYEICEEFIVNNANIS